MSDAGNPRPSTGTPALPAHPAPTPPPSAVGCVVVPVVIALALAVAIVVAIVANAGSDERDASTTVAGSWSPAPTAPARTAPPAPTGTPFNGPDGDWSLTIDPGWTELTETAVQAWSVADPVDGFVPNVNVVTQPAPDLTLAQYVDASAASLTGFDIVDSGIVDTAHGQVGVIEYAGAPDGAPDELHFLAALALGDDGAAVATFTAPTATFEAHRAEIEPYLLTLTAS